VPEVAGGVEEAAEQHGGGETWAAATTRAVGSARVLGD
jgi:hypothetical protein